MITDRLPDGWGWNAEGIAEDWNDSDGSAGVTTTDSDDPNAGTEFGQEGDDYYGQSELEDLYTPDVDRSEVDDDGFQGEGSWMDFDKSEDGEGSRYDRGDSTNWVEDAALQFDTETVDELTVPDLDFTEIQEEVFSERGQTVLPENTDAEPTSTTAAPESTLPEGWLPTAPSSSSGTSGGTPGVSPLVIAAAAVVVAGAVAYGVSQS